MCRFSLQRTFVLPVRVTCILIVLICFSGRVLKTVEQGLQNCTALKTKKETFCVMPQKHCKNVLQCVKMYIVTHFDTF